MLRDNPCFPPALRDSAFFRGKSSQKQRRRSEEEAERFFCQIEKAKKCKSWRETPSLHLLLWPRQEPWIAQRSMPRVESEGKRLGYGHVFGSFGLKVNAPWYWGHFLRMYSKTA